MECNVRMVRGTVSGIFGWDGSRGQLVGTVCGMVSWEGLMGLFGEMT